MMPATSGSLCERAQEVSISLSEAQNLLEVILLSFPSGEGVHESCLLLLKRLLAECGDEVGSIASALIRPKRKSAAQRAAEERVAREMAAVDEVVRAGIKQRDLERSVRASRAAGRRPSLAVVTPHVAPAE
jgi:hypothetical protein